jgi:ubiquinone/menaquinone biosynthesis C-methylase UbiE
MYCKDELSKLKDSAHLMSMVSLDEILRFGFSCGLNQQSKVLDLCCGYGTILKIWSEAFGISGVGVDYSEYCINNGKKRLEQAGLDKIKLVCEYVMNYTDMDKYDIVICDEEIGTIRDTFNLSEKFLKTDGILVFQKIYSKAPDPPTEFIYYIINVPRLSELNSIFNEFGYLIAYMTDDNESDTERYVTWIIRKHRGSDNIHDNADSEEVKQQMVMWYRSHFEHYRQYEGQALFGLKKI